MKRSQARKERAMKNGRRFSDKAKDLFMKALYLTILAVLVGVLITMLVIPAFAEDQDKNKWTALDTTLQVATSAMIALDWMQTYSANVRPRRGEYFKETGFAQTFIGEHPTAGKINSYFIVCSIAHPVISYLLPKTMNIYGTNVPVRNIWQGIWFGIEANQVATNYSVGIRIRL